MKRASILFTILAGIGFAPASWSIAVGGTDVGGVDTIVNQAQLANSGGAELTWLQSYLGSGATIGAQIEDVAYQATDTANVFAFYMATAVDYFMIKNATWHALFQNTPNMNWAVFNTTLLNSGFNLGTDDLTISHVRLINPTTTVPEPGTLGLLGLGLVVAGLARKRRAA